MTPSLKTPVTYYGGKQKLVGTILPLIPEHKMYVEPFVGGGAIFFSKQPSMIEVLNDTNKELINFYRVLQNRFIELEKMISVTLHSRSLHNDAHIVYNAPHLFDEVKRAWAVWVLSVQSFSGMLDGSWGYDKTTNMFNKKITNKRAGFTQGYSERLQNVHLEAADAIYIIQSRDTPETFFYCDPPYFNSNCGHYDGYSKDDFENLLKCLSQIKGKFLLSSYPSDILDKYKKEHNWHQQGFEQGVSVNAKAGYHKKKWEMLTSNYPMK